MSQFTSPDLDAWQCYLIVALLGLVIAVVRIVRLNDGKELPGRWVYVQTWLLLFVYVFMPLLLFAVLDWTGVINDTSLLAAVVVALSYDRILAGGMEGVKAPVFILFWWQSIKNWSNEVSQHLQEREDYREERFKDRLQYQVSCDDKKFVKLKDLALTCNNKIIEQNNLDNNLNNIQIAGHNTITSQELQVREILERILNPKAFKYNLRKYGIIDWYDVRYFWEQPRVKTFFLFLTVIAIIAFLSFPVSSYLQRPEVQDRYYAWRLRKADTTELDLHRAREYFLAVGGEQKEARLSRLAAVLIHPQLSENRREVVMQLLLAQRNTAPGSQTSLADVLIPLLRTPSAMVRTQVHQTLLKLAQDRKVTIKDKDLKTWQPDGKETGLEVEKRLEQWQGVFSPLPQQTPASSGRTTKKKSRR